MKKGIVNYSLMHPKTVFLVMLLLVAVLGAMIPRIHIDTDPENMLSADNPQRLLHNEIKQRFNLYDMIVVGVVNNTDSNGIFNPATLANIVELSKSIEKLDGVIRQDMMTLQNVDNISQEGPGSIRFQWLMQSAPDNAAEAALIKEAVHRLPLLKNTLVSEDNQAAGIYIPIVAKDESHRISLEIEALIVQLPPGADEYHITGLPVAEDTFGVEMFKQMAISAPAAGLVIFILLLFFFRSAALVTAPMLMAMATVITTMGLLIGTGHTVHIMSSMIPIFLMPIAVVDSVHLLSEFADRYRPGDDAKKTVRGIMEHLFTPMLYTSVTSAVGFLSLAFTPIPPVQTFGLFVAFGIFLAFALTVTFIPAYIAALPERTLIKMSESRKKHLSDDKDNSPLAISLRAIGKKSSAWATPLLLLFTAIVGISLYGIQQIQINDNPVKWFEEKHKIRIADKVLNKHFAGTYNAFLVLNKSGTATAIEQYRNDTNKILAASTDSIQQHWQKIFSEAIDDNFSVTLQNLSMAIDEQLFEDDENTVLWEALLNETEQSTQRYKYFTQPEALAYTAQLQQALLQSGNVGKSNGLPDLVKTVYRELQGGSDEQFRLPNTQNGVAQTILSFQGSHRPDDLWHMVTPDYRSTALWLQLKTGDNQDMVKTLAFVDDYIAKHPLPKGVELQWGGLTYINVVWQDAMVNGMLSSLMSAFIAVFVIMVILFRSLLYGLLAMIPLTVTIAFIYGVIGFIGKDYDMPVAVLSSLTLGLSIDFAIHFLERARSLHQQFGNWPQALECIFEEPARAISRNAIVIALGFTPLLLAPLLPYKTVGVFLATIMAVSCLVTLILLPAALSLVGRIKNS